MKVSNYISPPGKSNKYYLLYYLSPNTGKWTKKSLGTRQSRIAKQIAKQFIHELENSPIKPNENNLDSIKITLRDIWEEFLQHKKLLGVSEKTIETYQTTSNQFFKDVDPNSSIKQLNVFELKKFFNNISSVSMYRKNRININSFLEYCKHFGYIGNNFLDKNIIPKREIKNNIPKFFKDNELKLILEQLAKKKNYIGEMVHDMISILLKTGMRLKELQFLTIQNVDLDNGYITINNSQHFKTKTDSSCRQIPLSPGVKEIFQNRVLKKPSDNIFIWSVKGNDFPIHQSSINRRFNKALKDAKIWDANLPKGQKRNLHSLRHTFTHYLLVVKGMPIHIVSKLLGHSSIEITQKIYGNWTRLDTAKYFNEIDGWDINF